LGPQSARGASPKRDQRHAARALLAVLLAVSLAMLFAASAGAAAGTWERAWGKNVNGGGVFEICTVPPSCVAGSTGGLGGEMNFPRGVATDSSGNVYVADQSNNRIQKFSPSGTWERTWGLNVIQSGHAGDLGNVFEICTVAADCQAGGLSGQGLGGEMRSPSDVATDTSGNIYLVDQTGNRVQKFSSAGAWERAWGKDVIQTGRTGDTGTGFEVCTAAADCKLGASGGLGGELNLPRGLDADSGGNVYAADASNNRVQKFSSTGAWDRAWGKDVIQSGHAGDTGTGFEICTAAADCQAGTAGGLGGELDGPNDTTPDSGSNVYVADGNNNRVQKFSSSGAWDRAWGKDVIQSGHAGDLGAVFEVCTVAVDCKAGAIGGFGGEMRFPAGLATDASDNVYIADQVNHRIQRFSSTGGWQRAWGRNVNGGNGVFGVCTVASSCSTGFGGGAGGEMSSPTALATDSGTAVFVADLGNHRVQKFDSAKPTISTFATATTTVGGSISDQATLSGGNSPTGTLTFTAYGPNDPTCGNTPAYTSSAVTVSGNGNYNSAPTFTPSTAGTYRWRASYSGDLNNAAVSTPCNDTNETSFVKTLPTVTTSATANAPIGASISDQATIAGGDGPTGDITFRAYGPNDATCSNTPAYTSSAVTVSGNGNYNNDPTFTPATAGTYRWTAFYSGDANNAAVVTPCNAVNETSLVAQATPTITTQATANASIGASISDRATLSGGSSPGGTITFTAYGPGDATCAGAPAYTSSAVTVSGAGNYDSTPTFTPTTAGTYRWRASYSGDTNNAPVSTPCNDANETSVVSQATLTVTTQATPNSTIGGVISDQATLSGGSSPGGSITFTAYGPGDASCSLTPAYTSDPISVSGAGNYDNSPAFTPSTPGTYRWRASYSGDTNNAPVSTLCNDTGETSVVSKATPSLVTQATGSVTLGESISDQATLSGGNSPTGTITFTSYGPSDPTCANAPAYTSVPVPVSGAGDYGNSPTFTPSAAGTYRWRASYSGDANNDAVTGACNAANETSVVNAIPIPLPVPTTSQTPTVTGQRAAALRKCKKKRRAAARRKCKKRAKRLPL
jgi:NHL repeat